ncbi:MAG: MerR family transcriptional regulator [Rhodothermales bacterium]|nr:MerR family transcriptional regulator [Rhodothermales bacterium]MBO6778703.1 MerR family transcriptional regulator [Rhodothermales bacterium]
MTRSQLAARAGVNPETVRYYERRGLMPEPPRSHTSYRVYSDEHVARLLFIKRSQDLGFTLNEAAVLLELYDSGGNPCNQVREQALQKIQVVRSRIADLQRIETALSNLASCCAASTKDDPCSILKSLTAPEA